MAPRVAPGGLSELGIVNWLIVRGLSRVSGLQDVHLFSTLARQRGLFRAWLRFSAQLMPGGSISRHETELVILRVAQLRQCQYELDHHLRIGKRAGVHEGLVQQIIEGPSAPAWSERHRALLVAVDSLVQNKDLDDACWEALRQHYTAPQQVELCLLVGQYEMLATTIRCLRIERDY